MNSDAIGKKIAVYEAARADVEQAEEMLKELKKKRDDAENEVITLLLDAMEETEIDDLSVGYEGRKYSVTVRTMYSITKAQRDAAFPLLRDLGMGDLIQEKVDDRTLTKELEGVKEANDGVLPEDYDALVDCLSTYDKKTLNRRKSTKV